VQPLGCTYMLAACPDKGRQLKMAVGGPGKGPRKIFRP